MARLSGAGITQCRELECEDPLFVRKRQRAGERDRLFQGRVAADSCGHVTKLKTGENDLRNVLGSHYAIRGEADQSAMRPDQHFSSSILPYRGEIARHTVGSIVVLENIRATVNVRETVIGGQPQIAASILLDPAYAVACQTVAFVVRRELAARGVKAVQPVRRSGPNGAGAIDADRRHGVIAQAARSVRMAIHSELSSSGIETVHTGVESGEP